MAKNKVYALIIQGLVQGVGFRPFIYRIAKDLGMKGCVENMNNGVRILVAATPDDRDLLISRIRPSILVSLISIGSPIHLRKWMKMI